MRTTVISPLNVLQMVKKQDVPLPGNLDNLLQEHLIFQWQAKRYYFAKILRGKRFRFQFSATNNIAHTLKVTDRTGKEVLTIPQHSTADIAGNLDTAGDQLHTYLYKLGDFTALPAGYYRLKLAVSYDLSHQDIYLSEPFLLKDSHRNTIQIEYWHSSNKGERDMYFNTLPARYMVCVEGVITDYLPQSADVVYQDQGENAALLDSQTFEKWTLRLKGIPDWLLRKLGEILTCDNVLINGKRYVKASGSKWEQIKDPLYPMHGDSIDLWLADNSEGYTHSSASVLIYVAGAYPKAISKILIGGYNIVATPVVVDDPTEETAAIAAWNANLGNLELFGSVTNTGGLVEYNNGPGEFYKTASSTIYLQHFDYTTTIPVSPTLSQRTKSFGIRLGDAVADWGDGAVENVTAGAVLATQTHIYPNTNGAYSTRIFTTSLQLFSLNGIGGSGAFSNLTGTLPAGLQYLTIRGVSFPSFTFDFALLANSPQLRSLIVTDCALTAANGFNTYYLPKLGIIDFSNNQLPTGVVSAFMYDVWRNATNNGAGPNLTYGLFSISGQLPSALPLTFFGTTYENRLTNPIYGLNWTVSK